MEVTAESNGLKVRWPEGGTSRYPFVWLRDNAPEPTTMNLSEKCRARLLLLKDLDPKVLPHSWQVASDGAAVEVSWTADGAAVTYSSEWLRSHDLSDAGLRSRRPVYYVNETENWHAELMRARLATPADWRQMLDDGAYLCTQLSNFMRLGFVHVAGVPAAVGQLQRLAELLGFAHDSHYGARFEIRSEAEPSNLAYTHVALGLHTDLAQCENAPEIQVLHCISQAGCGGDNQFCDGFRVAELLKSERPEVFNLLTTVRVEFVDHGNDGYDFQMVAYRPIIEVNSDGEVNAIHFNNQSRSWFLDLPSDEIPVFYEAMKIFNDYCYEDRTRIDVRLNAGEMVIFANNRVLHGRAAYTMTEGSRLYEGGYFDFDAVRSKIRVLRHKLRLPDDRTSV